ncbi:cytokinin dehydrogenase 3-like [Juglans microcarpa x Juglans regia]|uniref:cytokinin dehydrogenase 3-like n=1 Tax=Juglans microcarpa x Juglans regia TaxID=2249226 RepID=UPI001B7F0929|nr:cytokinin dehydrogenase 3-like [Juglans microcarpa x Juglans regia]
MAEQFSAATYFMVILFIYVSHLMSTLGKPKSWINFLPPNLQTLHLANKLRDDPVAIKLASTDFGNIVREIPAAVLYPSSINDIECLIKFAHTTSSAPFNIAARGQGHSVRGQAMARNGVVVDMTSLKNQKNGYGIKVSGSPSMGWFADVGGEQLWVDVLHATLEHGLTPVSWTDYLYLTVGGTLSNAGISGQTFRYGPQISNVYEMDVITGLGDFVTCSREKNMELFFAVLGGLGQFGIIVRARIALETAPKRVKWVRMLYNDFSEFTRDQERLISNNGLKQNNALDYLEGLLLLNQGPPDNWRSSFFPLSDHAKIISLVTKYGIVYCLEIAKFYDDHTLISMEEELQVLFEGLNFIPGYAFEKDVSYVDFLNRVRSGELKLQSQGLWDVPHPWSNLFVPKSRISDFNSGVFKDIVLKRNITTGPVLVYPMNRSKWDDRMSAVIPEEDVFYAIGFLHSSGFNDREALDAQNKDILKFCYDSGIEVKQYLPNYKTMEEWKNLHFGTIKWRTFEDRKNQFDPKMILSPGQRIFTKVKLAKII